MEPKACQHCGVSYSSDVYVDSHNSKIGQTLREALSYERQILRTGCGQGTFLPNYMSYLASTRSIPHMTHEAYPLSMSPTSGCPPTTAFQICKGASPSRQRILQASTRLEEIPRRSRTLPASLRSFPTVCGVGIITALGQRSLPLSSMTCAPIQ